MSSEQARDLRQRGIAAAKAGQKDLARQLLQQSIRIEPTNEAAWLWLASAAKDGRERIFCLQKVLEINPHNTVAQQAVGAATQPPPAESAPQDPNAPKIRTLGGMKAEPPPPDPSTLPAIPLPSQDRIAEAQRQADSIVREYLAPVESSVKWVHKTRGRAGERDAMVLRTQVGAGIAAALVVLFVAGLAFILNNPDAQAVLFAPTHTPTYTPTWTATPTQGVTSTPSATPALTYTPSPTMPPDITPYNPYAPPRATDIYPVIESVPLQQAVALVNSGKIAEALPTMALERAAVSELFHSSPYYFEAIAQAETGNGERALGILDDAVSKLNANNTNQHKPIIDAGYAVVYTRMAEDAFADGRAAEGRSLISTAQTYANDALAQDPRNADTYLALARGYRLTDELGRAHQVLDDALAVTALRNNARLIVEKGEIYLLQREYDQAQQQAYIALYSNTGIEAAHHLRIKTALAKRDAGLAVIYAQEYLFYYPGSPIGYKLLGDARVAENKPDLAIAAYSRALTVDSPIAPEALVARALLYEGKHRYDLARDDYTKAFDLTDNPAYQVKRMYAAYHAGNFAQTLDDIDDLLGRDTVADSELRLLQARVLINSAGNDDDSNYREAATLLAGLGNIDADQRAIANDYLAHAQYRLRRYDEALRTVDAAMQTGETGERHYLRGLILEAQGKRNDAIREYEWVMAWSQIYPFSFRIDAQTRLEALTS